MFALTGIVFGSVAILAIIATWAGLSRRSQAWAMAAPIVIVGSSVVAITCLGLSMIWE